MFIEAVWTGERFVKYLSAVANAMSWNLFLTLLARKIVFFSRLASDWGNIPLLKLVFSRFL